MPETQLSAGLQLAWRVAGAFALETGATEIEPVHFLYGLSSLQKAAESETLVDLASRQALNEETRRVSDIVLKAQLDLSEIRATARALSQRLALSSPNPSTSSRRASRSQASRKLFDLALAPGGPFDATALLAALCNCGDACVLECLGDKASVLAALCAPLRETCRTPAQISLDDLQALQTPQGTQALDRDVAVVDQIDAAASLPDLQPPADVGKRFTFLCDLAWQFGTEGSLGAMLQHALGELLKVVPAAEHGQILVRESAGEKLSLMAHSSGVTPLLSMTSIRQAIAQKKGFLWKKAEDLSLSQKEANLESGLYVPLLANDEVFGVICLGTSRSQPQFQTADLQLANALAHQLGLAIAHEHLRRELRTNVKVLERLMTNFSPKVRSRLLQRARLGRLQLGGERATVSVVCSDIRGFTRIASSMDAEEVVDLLNDYFSPLTACIFQNDGAINDFVGDAVMAVFGSPEESPRHSLNALSAAAQMQEAAQAVSAARTSKGKVSCDIGIGVHCGEVVHGFVGSNDCMQFTVVGDVVNLTARYSAAAPGREILLSPEMHQQVWEHVQAEKTTVETKHEGALPAYRVLRLRKSM